MQLWNALKRHELIRTLLRLDDNARLCTFTEPLWTIPYYLYTPFASIYMSALGLSDAMIGTVSTVYLIASVLFSLISGVLTDKLGRRACTIWFDLLAWSVPTLLWAGAQNVWWFVAAAVCNGAMRITSNSWGLLLVEDEDERVLVKIYSLINIAASISAFAVLLSYPLVRRFGLVPTVRCMYLFAFVSMTVKFTILYVLGHETRIGRRRMEEVRDRSMWSLLKESKDVLAAMLRSPKVMWTIGLLACFTGAKSVMETFWPLLIVERTGMAEESLAIFSAGRSAVMLLCYFVIAPRVSVERFKHPLVLCFAIQILSKLLLILMPSQAFAMIWITVALDAFALSLINPLTEALQLLSMDPHQRARMQAIFYAIMLLITSPLGAISGLLSNIDRALPFVLIMALYLAGIFIARRIAKLRAAPAQA